MEEEIKKILKPYLHDLGCYEYSSPSATQESVDEDNQLAINELLTLFSKHRQEGWLAFIGEDEDQVFDENEQEYGTNDAKLDGRNELRAILRQKLTDTENGSQTPTEIPHSQERKKQ